MFVGAGTLTNVVTVLIGSGIGMLVGHRLPGRVRSTVTTALGLVTLLIAARAAAEPLEPSLQSQERSDDAAEDQGAEHDEHGR